MSRPLYNRDMRLLFLALALTAAAPAQSGDEIAKMTQRLAEEAEAFGKLARSVFAEETLVQRTRGPQPRFRPRVGAAASAAPKVNIVTKEVVSEYAFSSLQDGPKGLHEFRQVIRVDGKRVQAPEKARTTLSLGLNSK